MTLAPHVTRAGSLRILHVYKDYYPIVGGIENHIKMVAERQAADGHHVTVLVTNPRRERSRCRLRGVHLIRARRLATVASTPLSLSLPFALARQVPDVTHLHFPYPLGEVSQWLAGRGRPYVITYHSDVVRQRAILRLYRPIMHRILRGARFILVASERYMTSSADLGPLVGKCAVVPLAIDPAPFLKAEPMGLSSGEPTVLFVGRHRHYKGVDDLIRAMSRVNASLVVAGDGPMRSRWEALAGDAGVAARVCFMGQVDDTRLPRLYAGADVFVLPANSRAEAFGVVLLEAMAAGLPCVTTEIGTGTSCVVKDGVTGLVVPPKDPEALARALNDLLADPARRRRMGAAGRERVLREFTLSTLTDRIASIYHQVLTP
jgi:glycosyltransferase involved in cell wall biosynthesis